jgi:hypothetical protein
MFFSIVPPVGLMLIVLVEPFLHANIDRNLAGEIGELVRVTCALGIIGMMMYYISYIRSSTDNRLQSKKGLWATIIVLGNVFAVPVFWYLFINKKPK